MKGSCLEILASGRLEQVAEADLDAALASQDRNLWLDLRGLSADERDVWLARLNVSGLARKVCCEAADRTGFYPLREEICFVIPIAIDGGSEELQYVFFLIRNNLLITVHQSSPIGHEQMVLAAQSVDWLPTPDVVGLVSAIMIEISLYLLTDSTALRRAVKAQEDLMEEKPEDMTAAAVLDVRARLLALSSLSSEQIPVLQAFRSTQRIFAGAEAAREYVDCALVNQQAVEAATVRLDSRVTALRLGLDMYGQDQTNRRLNMLTLLAAIFNPLTLLAGIWGMNFVGMPELNWALGYPMALTAMATVGLVMFQFFRKGGWFD